MGKITFQAALGGSVDLVGPNTATAVTLNLPAASGNIVGTGSTGVVTTAMISGQIAVAQGGTGVSTSTGTGSVVLNTSPTLVTPALGTPASGVLSNATGLPLTTGVTGILPVANGGSGTATPALVAGTNVSITGTWPNQTINSTASGSGSVTSVATGTGLTGGPITTTGTIALANTAVTPGTYTAANITIDAQGRITAAANGSGGGGGTVTSVSVVSANGFTGTVATASTTPAITLTTSITGLLKGNGTAISAATAGTDYVVPSGALGTPTSGNFSTGVFTWPTFNQNTTGTAANVTGVVGIANGGTASTTAQSAIDQLVGGLVTAGYFLRGNNFNAVMSQIQASDVPTLNQNTTGTAAGLSTTLAISSGGTGLTTTPANGALDIGNGTGFTRTTLTAGSGVSITNASGSITIAATGSGGTVTSVTGTSPVVSSGGTTPAISLATAYGDTLNPYASKTANYVLAAPNGTAGVPTFRAIVAADIPTLNQNTTGTAANVTATSNATLTTLSVLSLPGSQVSGNISGNAANVTGTVAIGNGGTGQTTAAAGFNALSPITTAGDLILGNGTNSATRLGIGANGYVLTSNGTTASWAAAGGGGGSGTVTSVATGAGLTGGPITTTGTIALATTSVTAGSYTSSNITVDAYGRITAASNGTGGGGSAMTYVRTSFTATAGQTAFTVSYTVGYLQVFVNGVLLATSDYTATSGTGFTLGVGTADGDIVEAAAFSTGAYTRTSFTATAGQSVFTSSYTVGNLQVYVNGVFLATSDYTATNGTSFTLGVAAVAGDTVEAINLTLTTSSGGGGLSWQTVQTADFTATSGNAYPVNTTSGAITVTLPASPTAGNLITIVDYAGTAGTNNININPNGNKIEGSTANTSISSNRQSNNLTYIDATQGWVSYAQQYAPLTGIPSSIDYLVVAGGGGGGYNYAGGGGAGGVLQATAVSITSGTYTITVGSGGLGATSGTGSPPSANGAPGNNSTITGGITVSATGGGYGGGFQAAGGSGGSGGGGGGNNGGTYAGGSGISGQGYAGGAAANNGAAGSGGGAGAVGGAGSGSTGGTAGIGISSSISGSSTNYAGGGGGGGVTAGGASYGGGAGGGSGGTGTAGTANTGGGGGGGGASNGSGGNGGYGIVIIRYPSNFVAASATTGSPTITVTGGYRIYKWTGSGSITF